MEKHVSTTCLEHVSGDGVKPTTPLHTNASSHPTLSGVTPGSTNPPVPSMSFTKNKIFYRSWHHRFRKVPGLDLIEDYCLAQGHLSRFWKGNGSSHQDPQPASSSPAAAAAAAAFLSCCYLLLSLPAQRREVHPPDCRLSRWPSATGWLAGVGRRLLQGWSGRAAILSGGASWGL